jgi:hypothetical protein
MEGGKHPCKIEIIHGFADAIFQLPCMNDAIILTEEQEIAATLDV